MAAKLIAYNQYRIVDMVYDEFVGWEHEYSEGERLLDREALRSVYNDAIRATANHYGFSESFVRACIHEAHRFYSYRW